MSNGISIKGIVDANLVVHRFDHEYLDNNPPIPEIDTGLDTSGEAADSMATGNAISALRDELNTVEGALIDEVAVDFETANTRRGLINVSNKWSTSSGFYSYYFNLSGEYTKLSVTASSSENAVIALLASTTLEAMQVPTYASGYSDRISVPAGTTQEFTIPNDCIYILLIKTASDTDYTPASMTFIGTKTVPVRDVTMGVSGAYPDSKVVGDALKALAWTSESVEWVTGKYINTNVSVGAVVDVENPTTSSTLCYAICPCKAGEEFVLTCDAHGLNNPRAWAFVDTDYKLLSKASAGVIAEDLQLTVDADGYIICDAIKGQMHSLVHHYYYEGVGNAINDLQEQIDNIDASDFNNDASTALFSAQRYISEDWHFAFINVSQGMGLGRNHVIPATKHLWSQSVTADLNQCGTWMSDAVHPFKGDGVTDMYARTIASQLAMVVPSYRDGVGNTTPSVWSGRNILWMGTSIPAGSDPDAGEGTGSTYPALVASLLGATAVNRSKGSSCVRINASTGEYTGMIFNHFARALTRTLAECDAIATDWDNIKGKISGAPSTLSEANFNTMQAHSFENLLLPYLDGTNTMPDLFVIDHGHNDVRPKGIDGKTDLWVTPSVSAIESGILAEDTYMVADNYANLKLALNDDLSGITDLASFAASLNRNCFKGAVNFIITLILRYNPYARIVIVSDYN